MTGARNMQLRRRQPTESREPLICDGCRVREPHEHRCHVFPVLVDGEEVREVCQCRECYRGGPVEHGGTP
jgi:hypothetical protein